MSIKKEYLKQNQLCKVTFRIPKEISQNATTACIVGDFNNWDTKSTPMKRLKKDGSFSITLQLEPGKHYQFRYLLENQIWINDEAADYYVSTPFGDSENSVVMI